MFSDEEVRAVIGVKSNVLKKIRKGMREKHMLEPRQRINGKQLELIKRVVHKQQTLGITYERAIEIVDGEMRIESLEARFSRNMDMSYRNFKLLLKEYFGDNHEEVMSKFFESFNTITSIMEQIGDNNSSVALNNIEKLFINNNVLKYIYAKAPINI